MSEPVKTKKQEDKGRPEIAEEQYWIWLDQMRPFLIRGNSLWYAMEAVGIQSHATVIYEKYRQKGDFAQKIDRLQATVVELANSVIYNVLQRVSDRIVLAKDGISPVISPEEVRILTLVAEKHRAAQPFYVSRVENANAKDEDFGKVVQPAVLNYVVPAEEVKKTDQSDGKETTNTPAASQLPANTEAAPSLA